MEMPTSEERARHASSCRRAGVLGARRTEDHVVLASRRAAADPALHRHRYRQPRFRRLPAPPTGYDTATTAGDVAELATHLGSTSSASSARTGAGRGRRRSTNTPIISHSREPPGGGAAGSPEDGT